MSRVLKALTVGLAIPVFTFGACEGIYRFYLGRISTLPSPPVVPTAFEFRFTPFWHELGGEGPIRMTAVYPWNAYLLADLDGADRLGLQLARDIARWHLTGVSVDREAQKRHDSLSELALVVWISRNWTPRQVVGWHFAAGAEPPGILQRALGKEGGR